MMRGWKTWVAAIGTIALGVYEITEDKIEMGLGHIAMGLGLIGIGHKVEKTAANG
jgi:uncharacterized membrane protein YiaA